MITSPSVMMVSLVSLVVALVAVGAAKARRLTGSAPGAARRFGNLRRWWTCRLAGSDRGARAVRHALGVERATASAPATAALRVRRVPDARPHRRGEDADCKLPALLANRRPDLSSRRRARALRLPCGRPGAPPGHLRGSQLRHSGRRTAPVLAWLVHRQRVTPAAVAVWNVLGLAMLANTIVTVATSIPGPLHRDWPGEPFTALAAWPLVWLPAFLAPLAVFFHIVSLRQTLPLLGRNRAPRGAV